MNKTLCVCAILVALCSCSSLMTFTGMMYPDYYSGPGSYDGTLLNGQMLFYEMPKELPGAPQVLLVVPIILIDMPFSLVMDTFLLPLK